MERTKDRQCAVVTALLAIVLPSWSCSRTIEDDEPRELVDSRIEPCRARCTVQLDPECGARAEDHPFRTIEECTEDCAAIDPGGWLWARQADGTDACAEEWITAEQCVVALSCEDQRAYFRRIPATQPDYPCRAESNALGDCFDSTPSLEKTESGP